MHANRTAHAEDAEKAEHHDPGRTDAAAAYKLRLGAWMFLWYGLFYAGFVVINLYRPRLMEAQILFGLNLATVYGFGLIVVALIQALVYDAMCRARERRLAFARDGRG